MFHAYPRQARCGALLKADHRKVEGLFEKFEKTRDADRKKALVLQICTELFIHATIEEEIFYPARQDKLEDENLLEQAYVEHDGAKVLIAELLASGPAGNDQSDTATKIPGSCRLQGWRPLPLSRAAAAGCA